MNFRGKKAHGYGVMRWIEGEKYEGEWQEGFRHGKGTYTSKVKSVCLLLFYFLDF